MKKRLKIVFFSTLCLGAGLVKGRDSLYLEQNTGFLIFPESVKDTSTIKRSNKKQGVTVIDISGNVYGIITIGTQTWMQENLRTEKYNDGTSITLVTDNTIWSATKPMMCFYNNDKIKYLANQNGVLYNWYAISPSTNGGKNVCPIGWHVPKDEEWTILENYLLTNGYNYDGTTGEDKIAKSLASTTGWNSGKATGSIGLDLLKNNSSKFNGYPSGYRNNIGIFEFFGDNAYWWSASEYSTNFSWYRYLGYSYSYVNRNYNYKNFGFSVRCLKD